ncbi:MAG: helix-turn-helix transcriptional regulator [Candidatus Aminicenantales bacterium]
MMRHILILLMLINLFIGGAAALYLHFLSKWHRYAFLKHLTLYTVFMNIGILLFLISQYVQINLPESLRSSGSPLLGEIVVLITNLLISGMVLCLFLVMRDFLDLPRPPRLMAWILGGGVFLILVHVANYVLPAEHGHRLTAFLMDEVIDNIILLEVVILVVLLIRSGRAPGRDMGRLARAFGGLYLSRYLAFLGLLALLRIPRIVVLYLASAVFIYSNLVPFIWARIFFTRFIGSGFKAQDHQHKLELIMGKYAISKREMEILRLMLEGRNNKEIEQQLFISYHTVKNHVSSLYRKLGVKNRYQLLHLLTRERI